MTASGTALFQSQQLLSTEGLVMDLTGCLDEVLKVGTSKEVPQVDEFTMILILDVDDAPTILTSSHLLATDDDGLFASDHSKGDNVLDLSVDGALFVVKLIVVVWVYLEVVEGEFLLYALFESTPFFEGQGVRLGDDWDDVDDVGEFLEDDDVDWLEGVSRRLDEEETTVNAGILDVPFTLGGELFS